MAAAGIEIEGHKIPDKSGHLFNFHYVNAGKPKEVVMCALHLFHEARDNGTHFMHGSGKVLAVHAARARDLSCPQTDKSQRRFRSKYRINMRSYTCKRIVTST